jgi:hypothetical protein
MFGNNNPDPNPGSLHYGYDDGLTVDESIQADGEVKIIDFPGGLPVVCTVHTGRMGEGIFNTWIKQAAWLENSKYEPDHPQRVYLEESNPSQVDLHMAGFAIDLYAPIKHGSGVERQFQRSMKVPHLLEVLQGLPFSQDILHFIDFLYECISG